jgi:predicted RNA-binding protein with PIN domain
MHYLVDGYNLLFQTAWMRHEDNLEAARRRLIVELDSYAELLSLSISVVFDAPFRTEALAFGHFNKLKIIFTSRGQTADQFLIEWVQDLLPAKNVTVVTSDKPLTRHIRAFGVKVESVTDFLSKLKKRKQNKQRQKQEKINKKSEQKQQPLASEKEAEAIVEKAKKKILPPLSDLAAWEILFTTKQKPE